MFFIYILILIKTFVNLVSTEFTLCGNWTQFGEQKCIHIIDKEKFVSYENAIEMCAQTEKSHLITINSENEQKLIEKYLFEDKQIVDNVWIGLKNKNGFKWSDKSFVDYTNWADKSHINDTDLDCVQISTEVFSKGKWVNEYCIKKGVVVCQKTVNIRKLTEIINSLEKEIEDLKKMKNCENNISKVMNETQLISRIKQFHSHYNISKPFIDFDNKQKVLFTVWNKTYSSVYRNEQTFSLCESLNSTIIEIRSKEKQEILEKQIKEWFGTEIYIEFWLNGFRDLSGNWRWNSDGMKFKYNNWGTDRPVSDSKYNSIITIYLFEKNSFFNKNFNINSALPSKIICEHQL